ncbi:MAG: RIP metalloprotease RseP [Phycisphaerae bacterium]
MFTEIIASVLLSDLVGYLKDIWFILLVLIGFSVIIFVHELGHFLMAKWVGIRVETFAIGFGPRLLGFRAGGTDYCLRLLPLGGYVKMMGQEDFAMDQDRVEATKVDSASFLAKTPGQRALVVCGGVVMNVIFAAVAFIIVFMKGLDFTAPIVGGVIPESPAAAAGIQQGDKVIAVNGHSILNFNELQLAILTSDPATGVELEINRNGKIVQTTVKPRENKKEELLQIGVSPAASLTVWDPGMPEPGGQNLQEGDTILQVNSVKPKYFDDVEQLVMKAAGKTVELTVERKVENRLHKIKVLKRAYLILLPQREKPASGTSLASGKNLSDISQENVSLLGLASRRKFISTPESSATPDQTSNPNYVQGGDIVLQIGNILHPTRKEIRDYLFDLRGKQVELEVIRDDVRKQVKLDIPWREMKFEYLLGALGFDDMTPIVSTVVKGTPAAKLNIPRGAKILACNDKPVANWFDILDSFKANAGKPVKLTFEYGEKKQTGVMDIPKLGEWENTVTYAIDFFNKPVMTTIKGNNPYQALGLGLRQTWNIIKSVYVTIQRVAITRTIGVKQLSGPIYIIHKGKEVAEAGFYKLLYYMALISANLAVINFLPMPVVDGGLMLILLLEKIRRRALSARSTAIWQAVGLMLIVALFLTVTYNDISKIIRGQ